MLGENIPEIQLGRTARAFPSNSGEQGTHRTDAACSHFRTLADFRVVICELDRASVSGHVVYGGWRYTLHLEAARLQQTVIQKWIAQAKVEQVLADLGQGSAHSFVDNSCFVWSRHDTFFPIEKRFAAETTPGGGLQELYTTIWKSHDLCGSAGDKSPLRQLEHHTVALEHVALGEARMKDNLKMVLAALAIPLFALLIAVGLQISQPYSGLDLDDFLTASIGTALATIGFFVAIWMLGGLARAQRWILLLFVPALVCTMVFLGALTLVDSGLLIYTLYALGSSFFSLIPTGFMLAIGLGGLVAVFQVLRGMRGLMKRAETIVVGRTLLPSEHPQLMALVNALCARMGAQKPQTILAGLDPNFFVTEADVSFINDEATGRTLYISLPLCRLLSVEEFEGVLAHEFGHFVGQDTAYSKRFYPIYRGTSESLQGLYKHISSKGAQGLASLPALAVMGFFLQSFSLAESKISRDRELHADALAADATSARSFGSALIKVHAFAPFWEVTKQQMADTLKEGKQIVNASLLNATVASVLGSQISLPELGTSAQPHPTDSHPPLRTRLNALHVDLNNLGACAGGELPSVSALSLIAESEEIEKSLSDIENALIYRELERRHELPAPAAAL